VTLRDVGRRVMLDNFFVSNGCVTDFSRLAARVKRFACATASGFTTNERTSPPEHRTISTSANGREVVKRRDEVGIIHPRSIGAFAELALSRNGHHRSLIFRRLGSAQDFVSHMRRHCREIPGCSRLYGDVSLMLYSVSRQRMTTNLPGCAFGVRNSLGQSSMAITRAQRRFESETEHWRVRMRSHVAI
jgi:hypothetical protein